MRRPYPSHVRCATLGLEWGLDLILDGRELVRAERGRIATEGDIEVDRVGARRLEDQNHPRGREARKAGSAETEAQPFFGVVDEQRSCAEATQPDLAGA